MAMQMKLSLWNAEQSDGCFERSTDKKLKSIIIDGHCDTILDAAGIDLDSGFKPKRDINQRSDIGHIDIPRLHEAGVTAQFFALFTRDDFVEEATAHTRELLSLFDSVIEKSPLAFKARDASDIEKAARSGKVAAFLAIEGGEAIGNDLDNLVKFYEQGVRLLTITWNRRNLLARGVGTAGDDGLSRLGKDAIRLMDSLGMIVDVSHLSDQAFYELLDVATKPIVASHSNSRSLCPHPRNLSDDQARKIAATGGLIAITFAGLFIDEKPENVSLARLAEHIDHLVSVAGIDHIGLGSDFDGFSDRAGLALHSCLDIPKLKQELERRGYRQDDIAKIMGTNWARVMAGVM